MTSNCLNAFCLLALLTSCSASGADPVSVDPDHYKVEFENDKVRVLHMMLGPHEKTPMHRHPEFVLIALTANRARETSADGKTSEEENSVSSGMAPGLTHAIENLGDTPMERYIVEFKSR